MFSEILGASLSGNLLTGRVGITGGEEKVGAGKGFWCQLNL